MVPERVSRPDLVVGLEKIVRVGAMSQGAKHKKRAPSRGPLFCLQSGARPNGESTSASATASPTGVAEVGASLEVRISREVRAATALREARADEPGVVPVTHNRRPVGGSTAATEWLAVVVVDWASVAVEPSEGALGVDGASAAGASTDVGVTRADSEVAVCLRSVWGGNEAD